ncbi:MAG TPA: D-alanyl-D-alanine carboxypeptidase/D-alanyl-D-alanine-endopeptidase [Planctomycetaceae bacterium]|jgi:D-alanyl-D-alanine carboxypeptidase/D-alanyl-D-alanine-endopeptidase (penicillin-binding protein 4)|nr:D-alanyl-D-alanine carboxypeptidase/D-alanyl-D-alanine-endopeptidase [Planctomycetaceae bacterium]
MRHVGIRVPAVCFVGQLLICYVAHVLHTAPAAAGDRLSPQIREVIDHARFKHAHWGILVADRATGEVLYELEADKLFPPASTTKLYSVAAALDALGSDFCFETSVFRRGTINAAGVLDGDLILVAVGDLTMGGRTTAANEIEYTKADHTYANPSGNAVLTSGDPLAGLNALARQVAAAGTRQVRGQILIDARAFAPASATGSGPSQLTSIMINDNLIDFTITPGTKGSSAKVDWRPKSAALEVDAQVETIAAGGETKIDCHAAGNDRFVLRGRIAADRGRFVYAQEIADPARWARTLFVEALGRAGVSVSASMYDANPETRLPEQRDNHGLVRVALLKSPPFSENARLILKVSHNLHASTLPLLVAVRHGKRQLADGLRLEHDFLKRVGLDADSISFGGGAGGAPADYTTPRMTVALLRYMSTRPDFATYERALPVLGVDGTLADDVTAQSPARGKVRAKTGTLFWENLLNDHFLVTSKALAGYLTAKSGRELVFSFVVTGVEIEKARQTKAIAKVLARVCEIIQQAH